MKPSLSAFVMFLSTDLDMSKTGAAHEMFYYDSWDYDQAYRSSLNGDIISPSSYYVLNVPTLTDPSLAPKGQHLITVTSLVPYHIATSWRQEKNLYGEKLMQNVESKFPGLKTHTLMMEGATPENNGEVYLESDRINLRMGGIPGSGWRAEDCSIRLRSKGCTFRDIGASPAEEFMAWLCRGPRLRR